MLCFQFLFMQALHVSCVVLCCASVLALTARLRLPSSLETADGQTLALRAPPQPDKLSTGPGRKCIESRVDAGSSYRAPSVLFMLKTGDWTGPGALHPYWWAWMQDAYCVRLSWQIFAVMLFFYILEFALVSVSRFLAEQCPLLVSCGKGSLEFDTHIETKKTCIEEKLYSLFSNSPTSVLKLLPFSPAAVCEHLCVHACFSLFPSSTRHCVCSLLLSICL